MKCTIIRIIHVFIILFVCTSCQSQDMQIAKNQKFPELKAKTLTGEKVVFPYFLKGQKALISMVFEDKGRYENAQFQSLEWQDFWQQKLAPQGITFYEIPMMSGVYWIGSAMVDKWMRAGIPEEFHSKVASFYGDKKKYADALEITDLSQCYICLIDEEGNILIDFVGNPNELKQKELLSLIDGRSIQE